MSKSKRADRMINLLNPIIFRNKKILAGSIAALLGGGWYLQGNRFAWISSKLANPNDTYTEVPSYIYLSAKSFPDNPDVLESSTKNWWPWRNRPNIRLHWKLMKLSRSKHRHVRNLAVKALADLPGLGDAEYMEIAQASDMSLSVTLARESGIDLRFFLPPPRLPSKYSSLSLDSTLRNLLGSLPLGDDKSCIQYFTLLTGFHHHDWQLESEDDPSKRARRVPVRTVSQHALRALLSHSLVSQHRSLVVAQGGLAVLHRVYQAYPADIELQSLIAQILGNLAIDKSLNQQLFVSGWVGILAKWMKSPNIQLVLPATRALANMETSSANDTCFHEGVYILSPPHRDKESEMQADVIFIHGLLGGAFKTWRQHDLEIETLPRQEYTYCWPKDWLAKDCPNLRIVSLDYESHLSDWRASCPPGSQRHTLTSRSNEMMEKLLAAGLGERPIVWVTHSMGGLMVKLMLVKASESEDPKERALLKQTEGIVFYGVPHKGSALSNLNASARFLLLPSAEVREMGETRWLLSLNEKFEQLVDGNKLECLSFAETRSTKLGLNWNAVLVTPKSADPGYGEFHITDSDHLSICKPSSRHSPSYSFLIDFVQRCIRTGIANRTMAASDIETLVTLGLV